MHPQDICQIILTLCTTMGSAIRFSRLLLVPTILVIGYAATGKQSSPKEMSRHDLLEEQEWYSRNFRKARRNLWHTEVFEVHLFLELQYLKEEVVSELEMYHDVSTAGLDLCRCIQEQTSGPIVAQALVKLNATAFVRYNDNCTFLETVRVYDSEAVSLFGQGYLGLQLHVEHKLNVLSNRSIPIDTINTVISNSYAFASGGQRFFINCLHQNDSFESVISMDMTRDLSLWDETSTAVPTQSVASPTTPSPTESRSTPVATATPTHFPTSRPSINPTVASTSQPTFLPTLAPTLGPSLQPSVNPSQFPSMVPTATPSLKPSFISSEEPSSRETMSPSINILSSRPAGGPSPVRVPSKPTYNAVDITEQSRQMNDAPSDPIVIAAIAGAAATVIVTCTVVASMCWRRRKSIRKRRSHPKYALTTKDGQLSHNDPVDRIPGFVELDQRSLADTTLGEQTAGFGKEISAGPKVLRRSDSFDENSLYTTPSSVQRDEVLSYYQMHSGPSVLASQIIRPTDYGGNLLLPRSDSATTSSDGVSSYGPTTSISSAYASHIEIIGGRSGHLQLMHPSGPIDLDTHEPYIQPSEIEARIIPLTVRDRTLSHAIDETSASVDIDTWSCDFQDFDQEAGLQRTETQSQSPSHSSRSTMKIKNLSTARRRTDPPQQQRRHPSSDGKATNDNEPKGSLKEDKVNTIAEQLPRDNLTDSLNYWSSWSSRIFQEGLSQGAAAGSADTGSKHQSPLSILLDSVTQAVTPGNTNRSIPVVTPEETASDVDQPTETSLSREDESTLFGLQFKDETSGSSSSAGTSPNPWLLEKVEESLGPKSVTADMESLSGRSNLSRRSIGNRSKTGGSMVSANSYLSYRSGIPHSEIQFAPRTLEHDLKRLEQQLAALDNDQVSTSSAGVSSITGASMTKASVSSISRAAPQSVRKKKIVVVVPAGKLGVILANRHDGQGTIVSEIRESSPLFRMLRPGDKLVAVDDEDVQGMVVSQITSLMASRSDRERRLTVITSVPQQYIT